MRREFDQVTINPDTVAAKKEISHARSNNARQKNRGRYYSHTGSWSGRGAGQNVWARDLRIRSAHAQAGGEDGREFAQGRLAVHDGAQSRHRAGARVLRRIGRLRAG